jgi:hypothetical protein
LSEVPRCPLWVKSGHRGTSDNVCFTPKSGHRECGRHVRFLPKADIGPKSLIDEGYVPAPGMKQRICVLPERSL